MIDEMKLVKDIQKYFVNNSIHKNDLAEVIANQPKVNQWIPVSERLPEGCDDAEIELLISTHEAYSDILFEETGFALYYPKTKSFHSVYGNRLEITEIVTAWQYLPEPYIRKKVEE